MARFVSSALVVALFGLLAVSVSGRIMQDFEERVTPTRPPGMLICDGAQAEYRVQDRHVFATAFPAITDPAVLARARVGFVKIGKVDLPKCQAQRYPRDSPVSFQNSFTIMADYELCGFTETVDSQTHIMNYTGEATIKVYYPHPVGMPHIARFVTLTMGLTCLASGFGIGSVNNQQFWPVVIPVGSLIEHFGLSVSVKSRTMGNGDFGFGPTGYHVVTMELDEKFHSDYQILDGECWATPTPNRHDSIRYSIINLRGCPAVDGNYLKIRRVTGRQIELEVAEFSFTGSETAANIYFHCNIHVCTSSDPNRHCQIDCSSRNNGRTVAATVGSLFDASSGPIGRHDFAVAPRVVIRNGRPYIQN